MTQVFQLIPERTETLREQLMLAIRNAVLNGRIKPGERLIEAQLAAQLGVSRGPLREAIFQLVEEGLLEQVPYRGTIVRSLSIEDLSEIYSFRTMLETFAFDLIWNTRTTAYFAEVDRRHEALTKAIDQGNPQAVITAELDLHGLVYETSKHRILQDTWDALRRRLHVYFILHHTAHHRVGPRRDAHDDYARVSKGTSLQAMHEEINSHMKRGLDRIEEYLLTINDAPRKQTTPT